MKNRLMGTLCLVGLLAVWGAASVGAASSDEATFCTDSVFAGPDGAAAIAPARVPKTGQTTSYGPRDDGKLQKGAIWPNPRFTDQGDGTVRDNLTGLLWLKNANCSLFYNGDSRGNNTRHWLEALGAANKLASGFCDLSDGSVAGQWRLPNVRELQSLIDYGCGSDFSVSLPNTAGTGCYTPGNPFFAAQTSTTYWTSTTANSEHTVAFCVGFDGTTDRRTKSVSLRHVWPVRGPVVQ